MIPAKTMAKCPWCGCTTWDLGDQRYNTDDSSVGHYKCTGCLTHAVFFAQGHANLFVISELAAELIWIELAVVPAWALEAERLEAARAELSAIHRLETNKAMGLPPDARGMAIPDDVRSEWTDRLASFRSSAAWQHPKGFERSPLPPQMPAGMKAFIRQPTGWEQVNPEDTANLPIPTHPIRTRHEALFGETFAAVKSALEIEFVPTELPSGYGPDPLNLVPWYSFFIGPVEFTVGPRKRVISISAKSPLPMNLIEIHELSERDEPTYERDGDDLAVLIHAWGREKLLEYLLAIGRAARVLRQPGRGPRSDMAFEVRGLVNWPTHLHDDGQGGMVVLAVVDAFVSPATPRKPWRHNPWSRAELIEPNHHGISLERMEPVLACVPLGTSDGCWWRGEPDPKKDCDESPYSPWQCTLEDLTHEGRQLVRTLQELYRRPVRLVTHIDT